MLQWFRAMMPKEDRFFDLLEQHSTLVVAGAEALQAALDGGPDFQRHIATVMEREDDADAVTREVFLAATYRRRQVVLDRYEPYYVRPVSKPGDEGCLSGFGP